MRRIVLMMSTAALGVLAVTDLSEAKVPQEAVDALMKGDNAPLTPNGAIRAGSEDGSIPAWEPIQTPPSNYSPSDGDWPYVDPFADEKPLFTITAQNYQEHQDKLSPGQIQMLTRFPDTYRMHVYPTHRSWANPPEVYEWNIANASQVELSQSGNDPEGYWRGSSCFPLASTGNEMRLNSTGWRCQYLTQGVHWFDNVAVIDIGGSWVNSQLEEWITFPHHRPGTEPGSVDPGMRYFQIARAPARLAGTTTLVFAPTNYEKAGGREQAWQYNPGQRRVRRAPQIQYDYPKNGSNGLMTVDQAFCDSHGNINRYTWTLVGRREMYVPYNSYKLKDRDLKESDIFHNNHINQDLPRYELHRVWEVVGDQKDQFHMAIDRRVEYYDEDSYLSMMTDMYDHVGNLWRFSECNSMNYYNFPIMPFGVDVKYDFSSRAYVVMGVDQEAAMVASFDEVIPEQTFSVGNMKGTGIR